MTTHRFRLSLTSPRALFAAATMMSAVFLNGPAFARDDSRVAALREAEKARFEANVSADAKVLGELLDEGLEYVHSNGELDSKKSFIDSLVSGKRDYASTTAETESLRVFGDVAVIRGKARVTVIDGGVARDLHIGYMDVWLWQDGRWRMTAWRSARLPDSPVK
jgi:hypothetical protein